MDARVALWLGSHLRAFLLILLVISELFLVSHRYVGEVVKYLFLLGLLAVMRRRVRQVEELEETEVLQSFELALEERDVELPVIVRPDLDELRD